MRRFMRWIWQKKDWPFFKWDGEELLTVLSKARFEQGKLFAKVQGLGFDLGQEANISLLIEETVKTSEIEGVHLDRTLVRSSVAKHLGIEMAGVVNSNRSIDGLVEVLLDATGNFAKPFTVERLKSWQAALFPTGYSGLLRIETGDWRKGEDPMQVVSGGFGKEVVHYEAPPSQLVDKEMEIFFQWWESSLGKVDGLIRAGVAHFYFVTIHPFEDGNGRIARAITDMALAQDEQMGIRFYSLSSQIMKERKQYYQILEKSQKGDVDITFWLKWFLESYLRALQASEGLICRIFEKVAFWSFFRKIELNPRQRNVIELLLEVGKGQFLGGLTTKKYSSIAKISRATAFREITDLVEKNVIVQNAGKGRSVSYDLNWKAFVS